MADTAADDSRRGRFFGRAKGKTIRQAQRARFDTLLPRLRLPAGDEELEPGLLFPSAIKQFRLEIGFGGGEHLLRRAAENPETGFIGCEPFLNGMAKMLMEIEKRGLANIRLHDADAAPLLDRLKPESLDQIDMLYPDPWPKRRQRKRRLLSDETLAAMARILKPGGVFCFASDIDDYVGWTLARVLRQPLFAWEAMSPEDWTVAYARWPGTRYEAKAFREGRTPAYLTFVRR
jgi:tRNA (guanine-N7-)-methyltransferase